MPRKGHIAKRDVLPDPIYNSKVVTKLVNNVMEDGKKGVAQKICYEAFEIMAQKTGKDALEVFEEAMNNVMPLLEVKARIKAIMRRSSKKEASHETEKIATFGELKIDCESRRVYIRGKEVNLTAKEFDLLELLIFNPNKVYSRENLLNTVWGYDYPGDARTVDVHIRRLREKIEDNPSEPKYIHTKWGVGYFFQG